MQKEVSSHNVIIVTIVSVLVLVAGALFGYVVWQRSNTTPLKKVEFHGKIYEYTNYEKKDDALVGESIGGF